MNIPGEEEQMVRYCCYLLRRSGREWGDIRAAFLALDPPYTGRDSSRRWTPTQTQRRELYERQAGRCAYCDCELLPIDAKATPALRRRVNVPEVDHKRPVSRGGQNDAGNLCYACRRCNQAKDTRTAAEFADFPNDAVTRMGLDPVWAAWMIDTEDRHDWPRLLADYLALASIRAAAGV